MLFSIQEVPSQIPQDNPIEMREQNCALQRELAALKVEKRKLLQDVEQKRREAGDAQQQAQQQLEHALSVNTQIRDKLTEARREAEENARKLQHLQSKHSPAMERLDSQGNLLASRTRELTVAQRFLTMDSIPGADVIRMVKKLSNDILQCAAHLAETLPKTARFEPTDSENVDVAYTQVWELGPGIFDLLKSHHHQINPSITLQIAFQTCFIHSCAHVIGTWHNDEKFDTAFKSLYHELRHTSRSVTDVLGHNL